MFHRIWVGYALALGALRDCLYFMADGEECGTAHTHGYSRDHSALHETHDGTRVSGVRRAVLIFVCWGEKKFYFYFLAGSGLAGRASRAVFFSMGDLFSQLMFSCRGCYRYYVRMSRLHWPVRFVVGPWTVVAGWSDACVTRV